MEGASESLRRIACGLLLDAGKFAAVPSLWLDGRVAAERAGRCNGGRMEDGSGGGAGGAGGTGGNVAVLCVRAESPMRGGSGGWLSERGNGTVSAGRNEAIDRGVVGDE